MPDSQETRMTQPPKQKAVIGRPTQYIPEVIYPKIESYMQQCGREQTSLPTIEGLALYLGVHKDTLYEWSEQHPAFSDALSIIKDKQKQQLIDDGLYGGKEVNSGLAIFLLKANHGSERWVTDCGSGQ